jgi:hypothetical protein
MNKAKLENNALAPPNASPIAEKWDNFSVFGKLFSKKKSGTNKPKKNQITKDISKINKT